LGRFRGVGRGVPDSLGNGVTGVKKLVSITVVVVVVGVGVGARVPVPVADPPGFSLGGAMQALERMQAISMNPTRHERRIPPIR